MIEIEEMRLGMQFLYIKTILCSINIHEVIVIKLALNNISKYGLLSDRVEHNKVPPTISVGPKTYIKLINVHTTFICKK